MSNRQLEIIMRLRDEVTKKLQGVEGAFRKFSQEVKEFAKTLKRIGTDISHVGGSFIMFGAALTGPLALAFNQAAKYSSSVTNEITRLKTVTDAFQIGIAEALVPVMHTLVNMAGRLYQAWDSLGKAKQAVIIQGVFLTGVLTTLGGVILKVIGGVMTTAGRIILLVRAITPVQWAVLAVVAAVALMIEHWERVRQVVVPVLNGIEIAANMVAIGFQKVMGGMAEGLIRLSLQFADFLRLLARVPGPQQNVFIQAAGGLDTLASKLRVTSVATRQTVGDLEGNIRKIFQNGTGRLADFADTAKSKLEALKQFFKTDGGFDFTSWEAKMKGMEAQTKLMADTMTTIAQGTAQGMSSAFSTFFFDAFTGQVKKAKEYFADFGRVVLQILSQALAKFILVKTIGAAFPGMAKFFHSGGVVRAHTGYLASDEVPIIAQAGEGIVSRRGMAQLGAYNLNRINQGSGGGGGVVININPVIQAWDASDVYRNRQMITGVVGEAIRSNADIRKIIKGYT